MPPKVREWIPVLHRGGFVWKGGKGSHRKFVHPRVRKIVLISGSPGDDAKVYLIVRVRDAIRESRS
jgi:predicted RNA binding protein YcfA (HicA-like mRNA interferase family)